MNGHTTMAHAVPRRGPCWGGALLGLTMAAAAAIAGEARDTAAAVATASVDARQYADAVARLEEHYSAYDSLLAEQLMSLGLALQAQGNHENALDAFRRALHVTRINEGLYTLAQVPIIDNMLDSFASSGLWNDAHRQFDYLYWLNKRNYGASDPRMLPIIGRMADWHLNAYAARRGVRMYRRLMMAQELNMKAVEIIESHYGEDDPRLATVLRRSQWTNYFLATYSGEPSDEQVKISVSINGSAPNEPTEYERAVLLEHMEKSYSRGREALERLSQIYATDPNKKADERVGTRIALADWFLIFGKNRKALRLYEDVHQQLAEHQLNAAYWFAEPRPLPDVDLHQSESGDRSPDHSATQGSAVPYVLASFDVNESGKVQDVVVMESAGLQEQRNRYRVRRWLLTTRFRPRFDDGKPVLTEDIVRRFRFYEDARGVEITIPNAGAGSS